MIVCKLSEVPIRFNCKRKRGSYPVCQLVSYSTYTRNLGHGKGDNGDETRIYIDSDFRIMLG